MTDVPMQVGAGAVVTGPWGLRARTSLGFLPRPYVTLINAVVQGFDAEYTDDQATLVEETLQDSLVWRTHLGWMPWRDLGLYAHLGYTLVTLGGGSTTSTIVQALTGYQGESGASERSVEVKATLHLLDVELGWQRQWAGGLNLRLGLGWSRTVASSAVLTADKAGARPGQVRFLDALEDAGESYLEDTFETWVHPPTLAVGLGWIW